MNYEDRVTKEYIENALANAGTKIVTGSYVGDGEETRTIDLPFAPKLAILFARLSSSEIIFFLTQEVSYYCANVANKLNGQLFLNGSRLEFTTWMYGNTANETVRYLLFG